MSSPPGLSRKPGRGGNPPPGFETKAKKYLAQQSSEDLDPKQRDEEDTGPSGKPQYVKRGGDRHFPKPEYRPVAKPDA